MSFMTLHGFPAARVFAGMSWVTTDPAPIVVLSPIVTPGKIIAPPPIHTLLPIVTGAVFDFQKLLFSDIRSDALIGWVTA